MNENISYGVFDPKKNRIYSGDDKKFEYACENIWRLSSPEVLIKTGIGHCWDQVELERDFFTKHDYKFKTFFIWFKCKRKNTYPTHTYLVYQDKNTNKWCWFEHADYVNRGIHEFKSLKAAIDKQRQAHIAYAKSYRTGKTDTSKIEIIEYSAPPTNCTMSEFMDFVLKKNNTHNSIFKKSLPKRIETTNLILKIADDTIDAKKCHENFFCSETTAKYMLWKPTKNTKDAQEKIDNWTQAQQNQKNLLIYFIYEKKSNEPIGFFSIKKLDKKKYGDIGLCFGEKNTHKGYGYELMTYMLDYLKKIGTKEVEYSCFSENLASIKLAEKLGFKFDHTAQRTRQWDSKTFDENFYTIRL